MSRKRIPLGTLLTRGRSQAAGQSSLVNLYAEPVKGEGRTQLALYPFPGKVSFCTIGATIRGQLEVGNTHYVVAGETLYSVDSAGTESAIDTVEGTALVDMDYNGTQLVIIADLKAYAYNASTGIFAEIVDPDVGGRVTSTASIDGYSLFTIANTDIFKWSALANAASVDALDFATAATKADYNVAIRVANKAVWIFGKNTTEFWYDSGDPLQAFQAYNAAPIEIGCFSRDSIVLADTGFIWLGRDGRSGGAGIYRASGFQAVKISTPAQDRYLEAYSDLTKARALSFQFQGHLFYCITLPGAVTLYFDLATSNWGYLRSGLFSMDSEVGGEWDAVTFATNGQNRIVGASDGNLYKLDPDTYTDAGNNIVFEVTFPQISLNGKRGTMPLIEVDMQFGVGNTVEPGLDPQVQLALLKDDGVWTSPRTASMGKKGERGKRAFWTMNGSFSNCVPKMRCTDPNFVCFLGAWAEVMVEP
jgi:hypothetical protein